MKKSITCPKCNGWGYQCEECSGTGISFVPATNADRIRAMSDEELAKWICSHFDCDRCLNMQDHGAPCGGMGALLEWLQQPCRENTDD